MAPGIGLWPCALNDPFVSAPAQRLIARKPIGSSIHDIRAQSRVIPEVGFPRFGGHRSGIRGSECTGSDELLFLINRAQIAQR